jgi:hypothetical protein
LSISAQTGSVREDALVHLRGCTTDPRGCSLVAFVRTGSVHVDGFLPARTRKNMSAGNCASAG